MPAILQLPVHFLEHGHTEGDRKQKPIDPYKLESLLHENSKE